MTVALDSSYAKYGITITGDTQLEAYDGGGYAMVRPADCVDAATASVYWEAVLTAYTAGTTGIGAVGLGHAGATEGSAPGDTQQDPALSWGYANSGGVQGGQSVVATLPAYGVGDVIRFKVVAGVFSIALNNGSWTQIATGITGNVGPAGGSNGNGDYTYNYNFGASSFTYADLGGASSSLDGSQTAGLNASAALTDSADANTADFSVSISASAGLTDSGDTLVASTSAARTASVTLTDATDAGSAAASVRLGASAGLTDGSDSLAVGTAYSRVLTAAYTDTRDTLTAYGTIASDPGTGGGTGGGLPEIGVTQVWAFPPSWGDGPLIETFSFLTTVMPSQISGIEQRQSMRSTPRKLIEGSFTILAKDRVRFDLMLQAVGVARWKLPLWHYAILASDLNIGDFSIDYDFSGRDLVHGQELLLFNGDNALDYEIVTVGSLDANNHVQLVSPIKRHWPIAAVVPLREAYMTAQPQPLRINGYATTVQARFQLIGPNRYNPAPLDMYYKGFPVILGNHGDMSQGIQNGYQRFAAQLDSTTGAIYRVDTAGRGSALQSHGITVQGAYSYNRLKDLIYTLKGRNVPAWVPTFADDFKLTRRGATGDTTLVVDGIAYSTFGLGNADRKHLFLELNNGNCYCYEIMDAAANGNGSTETLVLDRALEEDFEPYEVYQISFMALSRLVSDDIEVNCSADIGGISATTLTFQTAPDLRNVA